jgi:hypothetical protein
MNAADVVAFAEEGLSLLTDMKYDPETKRYFDAELNLYYDPENKSYFDKRSGKYYRKSRAGEMLE